jgi:hypothetical protein
LRTMFFFRVRNRDDCFSFIVHFVSLIFATTNEHEGTRTKNCAGICVY